jgi:hypothetical protein
MKQCNLERTQIDKNKIIRACNLRATKLILLAGLRGVSFGSTDSFEK